MNNAFDFARTAVKLYQQGNPIVLTAADLLFDYATIPLAMREYWFSPYKSSSRS